MYSEPNGCSELVCSPDIPFTYLFVMQCLAMQPWLTCNSVDQPGLELRSACLCLSSALTKACGCHSWLKHLFLLSCPQREYIHPIPIIVLTHCIQLSVHGPPAKYGTVLSLCVSSLGLVSKIFEKKKTTTNLSMFYSLLLLPDNYDVLDFC